jgi:hypothetical protein
MKSHGSAVGIASGYGLEDRGVGEFESRRSNKFSLLHIVHTGSGAHLASYPVVERPRREALICHARSLLLTSSDRVISFSCNTYVNASGHSTF